MAAMVFMLSNACCERGFSLQNHIKGGRSTAMTTETLSGRMRGSWWALSSDLKARPLMLISNGSGHAARA